MKKFFVMLIVMVVLLGVAVGLSACNSGGGECEEHVFRAWEVTSEPTCTELGARERVCKNCGYVQKGTIQKKPHTEVLEGAIEATCTDAGFSGTKKCGVCGAVLEEGHVIDALEHDMTGLVHYVVQKDGVTTHMHSNKCKREGCDFVETDEACDIVQTVNEATCVKGGDKKIFCDKCKFEDVVETYEALGHNWDRGHAVSVEYNPANRRKQHKLTCLRCGKGDYLEDCSQFDNNKDGAKKVEQTCDNDGYTPHKCEVCDGEWKTDVKTKLGHKWETEWHVVEEADCHKEGFETQSCERCGDTTSRNIPKLQHVWGEWEIGPIPACREGAYDIKKCTLCGDVSDQKQYHEEVSPHKYGNWIVVTPAKCTTKGLQKRVCELCNEAEETQEIRETGHKSQVMPYKAPTCTATGLEAGEKCSVCNTILKAQKEIPALGHKYQKEGAYQPIDNERVHNATCDVCGETTRLACGYDSERHFATCDEPGYLKQICRFCNNYYIAEEYAPIGHDYYDYTNYIDDSSGEHVHMHRHACRRAGCGHVEEGRCEWIPEDEWERHEATCTVSGFVVKTCKTCGDRHEEITEVAPGHTYGEAYEYTEIGNLPAHYRVCTKCAAETEHMLCDIAYATHDATCTSDGYTDGTCTVCGFYDKREEVVPAFGHQYGPWTYAGENPLTDSEHKHQKQCLHCDDIQTEPCVEVTNATLPTCTSDGHEHTYCSECMTDFENETVNSLGHKWEEQWHIDEEGGKHYHFCAVCEEKEEFEHKYETTIEAATCTADRVLHSVCSVCEHKKDETVADTALGHSWGEWEITADNGFAAIGTHSRKCLTCEAYDEQNNGAHDYGDSNICPVCGHDGLTYELQGAHYIVAGDANVYDSATRKGAAHIIIPAEHRAIDSEAYLPVIAVKANAFINNAAVRSVRLAYSVGTVERFAFADCTGLESVTIDDSERPTLTTVGEYAFRNCDMLAAFEAPDSLVSIGAHAFDGCEALGTISIPDHVTHIGADAFKGTAYVSTDGEHWDGNALYIGKHLISTRKTEDFDGKFEIAAETVSVNAEAFVPLGAALVEVVLHGNIDVIERDAFKGCENIARVEFAGTMQQWLAITFVNDLSSPLAYSGASLHIDEATGRIDIPDGTTRIPAGTFRGTQITEVHIPDSVTYIGAEAFADCELLTLVTMTDHVTYIGADAFKGSALYDDPDARDEFGVLYIGNHLIAADPAKCVGAYEVAEGTVYICSQAFKGCAGLTSVTIGESVMRIGAGAFADCAALEEVRFSPKNDWYAQGLIGRYLEGERLASDPKGTRRSIEQLYYGEWKVYNK